MRPVRRLMARPRCVRTVSGVAGSSLVADTPAIGGAIVTQLSSISPSLDRGRLGEVRTPSGPVRRRSSLRWPATPRTPARTPPRPPRAVPTVVGDDLRRLTRCWACGTRRRKRHPCGATDTCCGARHGVRLVAVNDASAPTSGLSFQRKSGCDGAGLTYSSIRRDSVRRWYRRSTSSRVTGSGFSTYRSFSASTPSFPARATAGFAKTRYRGDRKRIRAGTGPSGR
jgi:hypothetical protein